MCSLFGTLDAVTNLEMGDFETTREEHDPWIGEPNCMALFTFTMEDLTRGEELPDRFRGQWWCNIDLAPEMGEERDVLVAMGTTAFPRPAMALLLLVIVVSENRGMEGDDKPDK